MKKHKKHFLAAEQKQVIMNQVNMDSFYFARMKMPTLLFSLMYCLPISILPLTVSAI